MSQLDTLPPEILLHILTFTEPTCNLTLDSYPLNALAATNQHLHALVEEYARSLLKQHANLTPPKSSKTFTCRRKWLADLCQYCKKPSKRKACLYRTLTCCRACDKAHFPKMTMTQAIQDYNLSKLDLFTPNILHPSLPRLAVGSHPVMGGVATLISAPDVLARRDYVRSLLGDKVNDAKFMRLRPAAHDRITKHLGIELNRNGFAWTLVPRIEHMRGPLEKETDSMRTKRGRIAYVNHALEKERALWNVGKGGGSNDTAIELD